MALPLLYAGCYISSIAQKKKSFLITKKSRFQTKCIIGCFTIELIYSTLCYCHLRLSAVVFPVDNAVAELVSAVQKKKKATKPQHPLNKGCDSFWKLVKDKSWQSTYFCMTERSNLSLLKAGRQSLYISGAAADNIQQGSGKKILVFHVSFLPFLPWISSPQLNCGVLWALTVHARFFRSLILPFPLCFQNTS